MSGLFTISYIGVKGIDSLWDGAYLEVLVEMFPASFDVLIELEREVGFGWKAGHVGMLSSQLAIQLEELIEALVKRPLASA